MKWREFIDAFSLSGAIILILASLTASGVAMAGFGNPEGEKVWTTFGAALTGFISARKLEQIAKSDADDQPGNGQG